MKASQKAPEQIDKKMTFIILHHLAHLVPVRVV
jgi:hypothetical protein